MEFNLLGIGLFVSPYFEQLVRYRVRIGVTEFLFQAELGFERANHLFEGEPE